MRIIAGTRARMTILPPRDMTTRPITDRVKESLFGILGARVEGVAVADLFCGTGSLGLEALSRGAAYATFVDRDREALRRLAKNLAHLKFEDRACVFCRDAFREGVPGVSDEPGASPAPLDIVFIDPPYRLSRDVAETAPLGRLLLRLDEQTSLDALLVIRHERRVELADAYGHWRCQQRRRYGSMTLTFLERTHG